MTYALPRQSSSQVGFTIVAVLIIVGLIATVSATYVKHVIADQQHSIKTNKTLGMTEAVHSGLQFVKQSMASGQGTLSQVTVSSGKHQATLEVTDLANNHARCEVQSLGPSGLGKTLLAEAGRVPAARASYVHPDELPRLWADTASAVLLDTSVPKTYIDGQVSYENTELSGLIVIRNTSALFLRDVIVHGAIVSEDVLVDMPFGDYDSLTTPMLLMDGNTRIEAGAFLPGVAVCIPDGLCSTWTNDARIQITGDVVAHTVTLNRPGVLRGNVANITALELHTDLDRPGFGRVPVLWSESLDMQDSWDNEFMAFLPRFSTVAQLDPIRDFWAVVEGDKAPPDGADEVAAENTTDDGRKIYSGRSGRSGMNASQEKIKQAKKAKQLLGGSTSLELNQANQPP